MSAGANPVDGASARFDPDEVVAEVVQMLFDAGLPSLADGNDANYGCDADGNAQHR